MRLLLLAPHTSSRTLWAQASAQHAATSPLVTVLLLNAHACTCRGPSKVQMLRARALHTAAAKLRLLLLLLLLLRGHARGVDCPLLLPPPLLHASHMLRPQLLCGAAKVLGLPLPVTLCGKLLLLVYIALAWRVEVGAGALHGPLGELGLCLGSEGSLVLAALQGRNAQASGLQQQLEVTGLPRSSLRTGHPSARKQGDVFPSVWAA